MPKLLPDRPNVVRNLTFIKGNFIAPYGGVPFSTGFPIDLATTSDGLNWTVHDLPMGAGLAAITYGNGTFVAVGFYGAILQSENTAPRLSAPRGVSGGAFEVTIGGGETAGVYRLRGSTI